MSTFDSRDYNPYLGHKDDFIPKNLNLAYSIANKYKNSCNSSVSKEDLESEAIIGLIKAFQNFEPTRFEGHVIKFSTFAVPCIRGTIAIFLRDKGHVVRVPRTIYEACGKILKHDMWQRQPWEISEQLDMSIKLAKQALEYIHSPSVAYLDQSIAIEGENDITMLDELPSIDDTSSIFVKEFLESLSEDERTVVINRLQGKSQTEIGEIVGFSQVHVSRMLKRIGKKLELYQATGQAVS
ncbi:sigma-70 family RNA polymerase sigma factor [Paenibacillus polymyxa]|uniref:sigma-70 family RNA polymerase sigma factor n=1 Tax=Paenibacillus polymyxa TaxID=1406 RepID=UPI002023DDA9|nr:sigma-70 family RNA polymerase sigma factor [Paenibacillus polymyxa]WDZ57704.1 sigma-70 family RNA polymerase sigma factor [Paenibacillus polymyxa]